MKFFTLLIFIVIITFEHSQAFDFSKYSKRNPEAVIALQNFLNSQGANLEIDGISGPQTMRALRQFQSSNNLKNDGIVGPKTSAAINKIQPANSNATSNTNSNKPETRGGSGKGDALDTMRGTNFCTRINGDKDGDGVSSCGTHSGDCKNPSTFPKRTLSKQETINLCKSCPDCQFIKGSCGTPLYFYKGNKNNAQTNANKNIKAVALTANKLKAIFGSSSQSAYCEKNITICTTPNNCKEFPVRDTGHAREDVIDMTGKVIAELGLSNDSGINTGFIIKRIDSSTKTADAGSKTKSN